MRERSDTWHEMRRINKELSDKHKGSNMSDCKHKAINLVHTELMDFCTKCCATICLVTGAIRDRHGEVIANITTPEWEPKPSLLRVIVLLERELEEAREADDGTEDLEDALSLLNMLRRKEEKPLDKVFERLNVLAKADEDKAAELLTMVHELVNDGSVEIDRDLTALVGLTRRADLHSRVAGAYRWAIHDIRCALGLAAGDTVEEISAVMKFHPTERK